MNEWIYTNNKWQLTTTIIRMNGKKINYRQEESNQINQWKSFSLSLSIKWFYLKKRLINSYMKRLDTIGLVILQKFSFLDCFASLLGHVFGVFQVDFASHVLELFLTNLSLLQLVSSRALFIFSIFIFINIQSVYLFLLYVLLISFLIF